MSMEKARANGEYSGTIAPEIRGMIDAHAYHCNPATWPVPLRYVQIDPANETEPVRFMDSKAAADKLRSIDGADISRRFTADMGDFLVRLNSRMYNEGNINGAAFIEDFEELSRIRDDIMGLLDGRKREDVKDKDERADLEELEKEEKNLREKMSDVYREDIPSLIIATTMDMEFAHIDGYDGKFIYQQNKETGNAFYDECGLFPISLSDDQTWVFQNWKQQVLEMEEAAAAHPFRLFLLFSYDPRRYRYAVDTPRGSIIKGCGTWKEPFKRIVGHGDSDGDFKKIWLGFCINPALGFRPFDEFCEHLPRFYKECADAKIPILSHCVPGGIIARDAEYYPDNTDERVDKSKKRHEMILKEGLSACQNDEFCSSMYYGEEHIVDDEYDSLDNFYAYHGHPKNWIPVLEYFPNLRLCLAGFGGNSEWRLADWSDKDALPSRQWIRCIIKLTAKYENVYTDMSGLNIYDEKVRNGLLKMLELMQDDKNGEFGHLKDKLIFGSGWYLTYLTDVADGGTDVNGREDVRHSYSNYCREFKNLFYAADKEGKGELWERVSLTNPQNFYALSQETIDKISGNLSN